MIVVSRDWCCGVACGTECVARDLYRGSLWRAVEGVVAVAQRQAGLQLAERDMAVAQGRVTVRHGTVAHRSVAVRHGSVTQRGVAVRCMPMRHGSVA